jgi:hypothetical protein
MKNLLAIIAMTLTISVFGQDTITMTVEIQKIDTTQFFYNYYTFDSTANRKENLIILKQIWLEKSDTAKVNKIRLGERINLVLFPIGPEKAIWEGDTITLRGHARSRNSVFIDGQLIQTDKKKKKSEFDPEKSAIRIDYFELKKIKNGG